MKYALIVAGLLASTSAFATNVNSPVSQSAAAAAAAAASASQSNATVNNRNSVRNNVSNKQGQIQGQGQAQQAQSNNSVTVTGDRNINAPGFGGFASGPCTGVGGQVSVGVAGFGGGAGFTALDESCTRRENARILHMLGQTELAIKLMMASPMVRELTETKADDSDYCRRNPTDYYCKK